MRNFIAVAALTIASQNSYASGFSGVPTGWKLESYSQNNVVLWGTPATCLNGLIRLPSSATVVDHNRLYATVMAAKVANTAMFILYEQSNDGCIITSFGFD